MALKDLVNGLVAAIGGVMVVLALDNVTGGFISRYNLLILIIGVALFIFAGWLSTQTGTRLFYRMAGLLLVLASFRYFIGGLMVGNYVWLFLAIGVALLIFNEKIGTMLSR